MGGLTKCVVRCLMEMYESNFSELSKLGINQSFKEAIR